MGTVRDGVYYSKHNGDEIDNLLDKTVWQSNPNLLDNWYFVGGGSQQGGGQFPINQRGQTSYTTAGYGIDRWFFSPEYGNGAFSIQGDAVRISQGTTSAPETSISQPIENPQKLAGKTVTASMLVKTNTDYSQLLFVVNGTITGTASEDAHSGYTLISSTITLPDTLSSLSLFFYGSTSAGNGNYGDIKAVKLELGDTQTLAHQENGVWVLNEVPNYQEQLARCQRYQVVFGYDDSFSSLGVGQARSSSLISITVPTPVSIRSVPSVTTVGGSVTMRNAETTIESSSLRGDAISTSSVILAINVSGATAGAVYESFLGTGRKVILDANL